MPMVRMLCAHAGSIQETRLQHAVARHACAWRHCHAVTPCKFSPMEGANSGRAGSRHSCGGHTSVPEKLKVITELLLAEEVLSLGNRLIGSTVQGPFRVTLASVCVT